MNSLAFRCAGITNMSMLGKLGEKLFPNASRWERRQKMTAIILTVVGGIILIATVALIMVKASKMRAVY